MNNIFVKTGSYRLCNVYDAFLCWHVLHYDLPISIGYVLYGRVLLFQF